MLQSLSPEIREKFADYEPYEVYDGWLLFDYLGYECGWGIDTDLYYCFDLDYEYSTFEDLIDGICHFEKNYSGKKVGKILET